MYEGEAIANKSKYFSKNFHNFLFTVNMILSLYFILQVFLYFNSQFLGLDIISPQCSYKGIGEISVLICLIFSGCLTINFSSLFFYVIFNLNLIMLNYKLIQNGSQKNMLTSVFSLFIISTNIIISFYSANFYLHSRGYIKSFVLNNYFDTLQAIGEEIDVRLDLIKININNIIINSGFRKYLSLILFKLDDYSFTSYTNSQDDHKINKSKLGYVTSTNTSFDNLNSKSTIDTEF